MLIQDGLHLFIHTILVLKPCLWVDHVFLQVGYLFKAGSKTLSIKGICVPWQWGEVQDQWDWICRDDTQLFWPSISPLLPVNISSMLLSWDVGTRSAVMEIGPTFIKRSLTLLCYFRLLVSQTITFALKRIAERTRMVLWRKCKHQIAHCTWGLLVVPTKITHLPRLMAFSSWVNPFLMLFGLCFNPEDFFFLSVTNTFLQQKKMFIVLSIL